MELAIRRETGGRQDHMRILILGCGYLGERVACNWQANGHLIHVLTRSEDRKRELEARGWHALLGDVADPESLEGLPACDVVLHAIGFDRRGPHSKRTVYVDGLENALRSPAGSSARWISISSTSVYGQSTGEWVDEESPCVPTSEGGQICLEAEARLDAWRERTGRTASVLRLSGLYGPGRLLARAQQLRAGEALSGREDAWLNLIHVDDAARIVCHVADMEEPPQRLLVSDDRPIPRGEYYSLLAQLAAAPPPRFAGGEGRTDLNKRCSNRRLRNLAVDLAYPTIATGLPHAWRETAAGS